MNWLYSPMLSLLRHSVFRRIFMLNLMLNLSVGLRLGAVAWLVYDLSESSLSVGASIAAGSLPAIVLTPLGGAIADSLDRRMLVALGISSLAILSAVTSVLVTSGQIQTWHLFTISALSGVFASFSEPAAFAIFGEAPPKKWMAQATSLRSFTSQLGETVGPFGAGIVIGFFGPSPVFWIMTAGFISAVVMALRLPKFLAYAPVREVKSIWRQISGGVSLVARTPALRWVALVVLVNNFTGVAIYPILPEFSAEVIGEGAKGFGFMSGAIGSGFVVGSLLVAATRLPRRRGLTILLAGAVWDAGMVLFGFQDMLWSSVAILFIMGLSGAMWFASAATIFQEYAPPGMRGRVLSVFLFTLEFFPLGWLFGGALSEWVGIRTTLIVSALASTPPVFLIWLLLPSFRRI